MSEGIKGEIQNFFTKHYPIPPMAAKAVEIALGSIALKNLHFDDDMGKVHTNIYLIYVGKSGLACKTPIISRMRQIVNEWDKNMAAPVKFTSQGFTEYATGRKRKKGEDGEPIPPHDTGIIIRDEFSRLFKEKNNNSTSDVLEFLSELHDCYIESYRTRTYGLEGGKFFYLTLFSATTETFLAKMDDEFFMQGLGNKILWICDNPPEPKKINHKTFFLPQIINKEWEELVQKVIDYMNYLNNKIMPTVFVQDKTGEIWSNYKYEIDCRAQSSQGKFDGSFLIKLPLQALRLSAIYAALRNNYDESMLIIKEENMQEAIDDLGIFEKQRKTVLEWWSELRRDSRNQLRAFSSKYDLEDFLSFAHERDDLFNMKEISAHFNLPSLNQIADVVALAIRKKLVNIVASKDDYSVLTPEQIKRFKPPAGAFPQVYKLTVEGQKYLGGK